MSLNFKKITKNFLVVVSIVIILFVWGILRLEMLWSWRVIVTIIVIVSTLIAVKLIEKGR